MRRACSVKTSSHCRHTEKLIAAPAACAIKAAVSCAIRSAVTSTSSMCVPTWIEAASCRNSASTISKFHGYASTARSFSLPVFAPAWSHVESEQPRTSAAGLRTKKCFLLAAALCTKQAAQKAVAQRKGETLQLLAG